ncbi:MAG: ABC transporter permease [Fusobacteriaceae bacterium]
MIFSFLVGVIPAYYCAYSKGKLASALEKLFFIPFIFPPISAVISFTVVFNSSFIKKFGINYTLGAIIIANCFYNSPIFIKYISEALKRIPREIEEAALTDGISKKKIFFLVKLPLILPQVFKGGFLVFLYSFTSFILVIALGGLRHSTLEAEIASTLTGSSDFSKVVILGVLQSLIMIFLNYSSSKIEEYELNGEPYIKKTSRFLKFFSIIYLALELIIIIIPIIFSFFNIYTGKISLQHYITLFSHDFNLEFPVIRSFINSIFLAGTAGAVVVFLGYLMIKFYNRFTELMVFFTFGISNGFLGLLLIYMNILLDIPLPLLLFQGYILISLPLAYSFLYQYVKKFNRSIREAALIDGADSWRYFVYIEFPLMKKLFLGIYLQIFALLLGEFTMGYTMQIINYFPTLPLVNYQLISSKRFLESSALNSSILILLLGIFCLSQKLLAEKD